MKGDAKGTRPLVLIDTNALLLPFSSRLPLESEIYRWMPEADVRVPSSVIRELNRLSRKGVPNARGALEFAKRFPEVPTDLEGDAAMETLAKELGAWVVTADGELRKRLEEEGFGVLFPTGRRKLSPSWTPPALRQGD
jgi:rRNA-processing protein FCF1